MITATYVRFEVLRSYRNWRFFAFSLAFPLILYVITVSANRDAKDFAGTGIPLVLYSMVGMVAWGSMTATIAGGARIAAERAVGWVRQLRLTPLSVRTYFGAKVLSGYAVAVTSIVLLYTAGIAFGVTLSLGSWVRMTLLILLGLVPFAAMGIWFGHVLTIDSMGPALGGTSALFALLGGAWGPVGGDTGWLHDAVQLLPSYWLVQAGQSAYTQEWWPLKAWLVLAVWTVVLARLARRAYVRDTLRI
ncbi:MAG TPA: ABC transporter permease [Actinomycetes bacterium]|nr:ABC transporter permease [Actinomycetes bacterium]